MAYGAERVRGPAPLEDDEQDGGREGRDAGVAYQLREDGEGHGVAAEALPPTQTPCGSATILER